MPNAIKKSWLDAIKSCLVEYYKKTLFYFPDVSAVCAAFLEIGTENFFCKLQQDISSVIANTNTNFIT